MTNKEYELLKEINSTSRYALLIGGFNVKLSSYFTTCIELIEETKPDLVKNKIELLFLYEKWRKLGEKEGKNTPIIPISDDIFNDLKWLKLEIDKQLELALFNNICDEIERKYDPDLKVNLLGILNTPGILK